MSFSPHNIVHPVGIVPWQNNFLEALLRYVVQETAGNTEKALIIFPHSRPRRYLTELFRTSSLVQRPCLLPQMYAVSDFFSTLCAHASSAPVRSIAMLDRVGLLLDCMQELHLAPTHMEQAAVSPGGLGALPQNYTLFFPWGIRLAALFEDFYSQGLEPEDLHYMEGEVTGFAARLLAELGSLHTLYTARLEAKGWTTPGRDAFRAATLVQQSPAILQDRVCFIAGFYALTGVEQRIFTHMRNHDNARVILHTDPALATRSHSLHWSAKAHKVLLDTWSAQVQLLEEPTSHEPSIRYYEGFDLHSQLEPLATALHDAQTLEQSAVILPDPAILMPLLHHLPRKDVNISMGYPLGQSPLSRLLDTIMDMQAKRAPSGGYPWRLCLDLIRHPYLKMLPIDDDRPLQRIFHHMESDIRTGARHTDPRLWSPCSNAGAPAEGVEIQKEAQDLINKILDLTITRWENLRTLSALAETLTELCTLFLEQGGNLWQRFPMDAECLYRLTHHVIPALRESTLHAGELEAELLFVILRETMRAERVPFEADPLSGLQVLGMLESRLLHLERVFIVDATEDNLPGVPANDPLLPESLRGILGLPDIRQREQVAAYTFFRLIYGAQEVTLLYQSGTLQTMLLDEKKQRSRFLEELIWNEEQKLGKILKPGEPPLYTTSYHIGAVHKADVSIPRTEIITQAMQQLMDRPLSPSKIDSYLRCPICFFYKQLCTIKPADEVVEGNDHMAVGELLHDTLQEFFTPYLNEKIIPCNLDPDELQKIFLEKLDKSNLENSLPYDSYLMLKQAGPRRLVNFLKNQSETTRIIALEKEWRAGIDVAGQHYVLRGRLDRVDERNDTYIILDYKTGDPQKNSPSIWTDTQLWRRLSQWSPHDEDDPIADLARELSSIQLPFYMYLYGAASGKQAANAGWVELRDQGEEKMLFSSPPTPEVLQKLHTLIDFILRHMASSPVLHPHQGKHCGWCFCSNLCTFCLDRTTG